MRYWFHAFGCRVNQYETQVLRERVTSTAAAVATENFEKADVCIVNTCTVTEQADKEALRLVRRIARRNPIARLVVTGCLASRAPGLILEAAPAAVVIGNEGKENLPAMLGCGIGSGLAGVRGLDRRARAFIKIQDGCNMECSYCIIPSVRPRLSSRPIAEIEAEARGLIAGGHSELVLCGIRLGRYLAEEAGRRVDFIACLERLLALPGDFRVRLSSLEITDLTDRLIDLMAVSSGRLCPSLHLPLQSGSDAVLRNMRRWYSTAFYARRIEALMSRLPEAALFADVMAGFPGETDAEFEESLAFIRRMEYSGLHVFRYSRRRGTSAARRAGQVSEGTILKRAERLRALDIERRGAFARRAVGSARSVVMERSLDRPVGLAEDFLSISLPRHLGPGIHRVRVTASDGAVAVGSAADLPIVGT